MQKDQLKQPTTKAPALCFIKAIPFKPRNNLQPGKILFQARKRPYNGRKDRRIINKHGNSPKILSGRDKRGKWVFTKSFRARQREKTSLCRHLKSYPPLYGWNFMFGGCIPQIRKTFFRLSRPCFKPANGLKTPERKGGQGQYSKTVWKAFSAQ